MNEIDFPVVDHEQGVIVKEVKAKTGAFTGMVGWYVFKIPDKDDPKYGAWRQADDLTTACDEELVSLPEGMYPDDVDEEWVAEFMSGMLLEDGDSMCKECGSRVEVGGLVRASGSYVDNICPECKGNCRECGASDWESLGRKEKNNARQTPKKKCNKCGNVTAAGVSTA